MNSRKLLRQIIDFTLVALLLVACSKAQTAPAATPGPSNTPLPSQEIKIISAYEGIDGYVEAAPTASKTDLPALYRQYVVDPYWKDCAAEGEYVMLAENAVATPITDMNYLTRALGILRESNVEQIVEAAIQEIAAVLSGPVCIFLTEPYSTFVREYMNGVSGFTVGSGKIWLQVYPNSTWLDWIPYTVAHEYHHSVWTDRHVSQLKQFDLVDYLVFEGRADSFARLLYPDLAAPWTEALTPEQEKKQWRAMQQYLDTDSPATQGTFIFGGGGVPRWTGYTIGFHIVQSYLQKQPNISIDEWTALDAHDLLAESGYNAE